MNSAFLIAAPQSSSGKTTVSLAIMAALTRRGRRVAPFKCGPDFIDPGYHQAICGRPSVNLDSWMCPESFVRETFAFHCSGKDQAVIEGVMGLFDGLGATSEGSSAQVAAITGAPVVLVVNARGMAASVAALIKGFAVFDPRVKVAGVIFNNVGSSSHADLLRKAVTEMAPELEVFGCIPRDSHLEMSSRHLGLVTVEDAPVPEGFFERLATMAETHLNLDGLCRLTLERPLAPFSPGNSVGPNKPRIAVARDRAFCFVYHDNLRLLTEAGAEIVPFSPLEDSVLPQNAAGLYLPGGYPELHAEQLTANGAMRRAIHEAVNRGVPVYAECGGLIYLTEGMLPELGQPAADFAGVFPVRARMLPRRKALGYRQIETTADSVIGAAGLQARGHEFHYSDLEVMPERIGRLYQLSRPAEALGTEGFSVNNCLASYVHLHFGSNPAIAPAFVNACRREYIGMC